MIADLFIKKDATVKQLIELYDRMESLYGPVANVNILTYGSVLTITIDAGVFVSNIEIHEAADELDCIIKDIVRRQ